ncbi:hypothetical protein RHSIM_Rhsim02G0127200 [Rhododendron simsii]|uniref:GRF-type domain-containing protein n=1 Tax=Rhododendron simsii TaxID=118357 RepID=A0A834HAB7_RHOSS|nr:hypothetical protein RHSIM_Rhsim02G0127200 [Rhododendron simsii]
MTAKLGVHLKMRREFLEQWENLSDEERHRFQKMAKEEHGKRKALVLRKPKKLKCKFLNHRLCECLVRYFDPATCSLTVHGRTLRLIESHVHDCLGINAQGDLVEVEKLDGFLEVCKDLGVKKGEVKLKDLIDYLQKAKDADDVFKRKFAFYIVGAFLCPTTKATVNESFIQKVTDVKAMGNVNWAKLILNFLRKGINDQCFYGHLQPNGCLFLLVVFYLDHVSPIPQVIPYVRHVPLMAGLGDADIKGILHRLDEIGGYDNPGVVVHFRSEEGRKVDVKTSGNEYGMVTCTRHYFPVKDTLLPALSCVAKAMDTGCDYKFGSGAIDKFGKRQILGYPKLAKDNLMKMCDSYFGETNFTADIRHCSWIYIPTNDRGSHWFCIKVDMKTRITYIFDSKPGSRFNSFGKQLIRIVMLGLHKVLRLQYGDDYQQDVTKFNIANIESQPLQDDIDCHQMCYSSTKNSGDDGEKAKVPLYDPAPNCHCRMQANLRITGSLSHNKGKLYFICMKTMGRCGFFSWCLPRGSLAVHDNTEFFMEDEGNVAVLQTKVEMLEQQLENHEKASESID